MGVCADVYFILCAYFSTSMCIFWVSVIFNTDFLFFGLVCFSIHMSILGVCVFVVFVLFFTDVYFVAVRVFEHYFVLCICSFFSTLICTFLVCGFSDIEN